MNAGTSSATKDQRLMGIWKPTLNPTLLPETLDYRGEFGAELSLFLPFVLWLSRASWLWDHRISTYRGMRCFYDDLECSGILEKTERRSGVPIEQRPDYLPFKDELEFKNNGRSPFHCFPDLRRKFSALSIHPLLRKQTKPLLIVHNKHNEEFGLGPLNYISLETLDAIFCVLKQTFTIIYIRHGMTDSLEGFSEDHRRSISFDDRSVLKQHKEVVCFDDLFIEQLNTTQAQDLNTFKNVLYSRCYHFISSQGGGANHMASFSGSLLMVLHRAGLEFEWAYCGGYYNLASNPAPLLAVCQGELELRQGLALFLDSYVFNDRVLLSHRGAALWHKLSPSIKRCGGS